MKKIPFILLLLTPILTLQTATQLPSKTPPPRPTTPPTTFDNPLEESAKATPSNHASASVVGAGDLSDYKPTNNETELGKSISAHTKTSSGKQKPQRPDSRPASLTYSETPVNQTSFGVNPFGRNIPYATRSSTPVLTSKPIITLKGAIKEEFKTIRNQTATTI
jgi:hypothetical protein